MNFRGNRQPFGKLPFGDRRGGLGTISRMLGLFPPRSSSPRGPARYRAYAIGDVHGRLDLLDGLLAAVEQDDSRRGSRKTYLVFLGDLIDRGPASRQVVERLRTYQPEHMTPVFLMGNHEEVLVRLLQGEQGLLQSWLKFGGAECIQSYGVDPWHLQRQPEKDALRIIAEAIPREHAEFLGSFADTFKFGDYLFVHAGIRPGVEIAAQESTDLRWIRQPFLDDDTDHGFVVVHGHTVREQIEERPNRVGIDTGAYRTGVLTAMGVEGPNRWYISTIVEPSGIAAVTID